MYFDVSSLEGQCADELKSVKKEVEIKGEEFYDSSICTAGVVKNNSLLFRSVGTDLPAFMDTSGVKCDSKLHSDNVMGTFQKCDNLENGTDSGGVTIQKSENLEKGTDSEDEMLTVHFEQYSIKKKYLCHVCCKSFNSLHSLKQHAVVHLTDQSLFNFLRKDEISTEKPVYKDVKQYKCDYCQYICKEPNLFEIHLMKHNKSKNYACDLCQKKFSLVSYLKAHILTHLDTQFISTMNRHIFPGIMLLDGHKRNCVNSAVEETLSPPQTNKAKSNSRLMHRNKPELTNMHPVGLSTTNTDAGDSSLPPSRRLSNKTTLYKSDGEPSKISRSKFTKQQNRNNFMQSKSHKSKNTPIRKSFRSKRKRKVNLRFLQEETLAEFYVKRRTRRQKNLFVWKDKKSKVGAGKQEFKCHLCKFYCSTLRGLEIHTRLHKEKYVPTCEQSELTSMSNLATHNLKQTGPAKQVYNCSACDFSCNRLRALNKHQAIHAQDRENSRPDEGIVSRNLKKEIPSNDKNDFVWDAIMKEADVLSDKEEEGCIKEKPVVHRCAICQFRNKDIEEMKSHLLSCNIILGI